MPDSAPITLRVDVTGTPAYVDQVVELETFRLAFALALADCHQDPDAAGEVYLAQARARIDAGLAPPSKLDR